MDASNAEQHCLLGVEEATNWRLSKAISIWEAALLLWPNDEKLQRRLDFARKEYSWLLEDIVNLKKQISESGESPELRYELARLHYFVGEYGEARKEWTRVTEIDPDTWGKSAAKMLSKKFINL